MTGRRREEALLLSTVRHPDFFALSSTVVEANRLALHMTEADEELLYIVQRLPACVDSYREICLTLAKVLLVGVWRSMQTAN